MSERHSASAFSNRRVAVQPTASAHVPTVTVEVRASWPDGATEQSVLSEIEAARLEVVAQVRQEFAELVATVAAGEDYGQEGNRG